MPKEVERKRIGKQSGVVEKMGERERIGHKKTMERQQSVGMQCGKEAESGVLSAFFAATLRSHALP